jgi:hypothetical protein
MAARILIFIQAGRQFKHLLVAGTGSFSDFQVRKIEDNLRWINWRFDFLPRVPWPLPMRWLSSGGK